MSKWLNDKKLKWYSAPLWERLLIVLCPTFTMVGFLLLVAADYHNDKPYPLTAGKTDVVGGVYDDTSPDGIDENDAGYFRMSEDRALHVEIRDGAGNERGLAVDASGNIGVTMAAGTGSNLADDAAFTPATSEVTMVGFEFDDTTPDSVNEGDGGAARMSANRNVYMTIRDAAGNERGVNVDASNQLAVADSAGNTLLGTIDADTGNILTAVQIMDDWDESDRAKVNIIAGQAGVAAGAGAVGVTVPRVTLASDDPVTAAVQIMDDWDEVHDSAVGTDGALVMGEAHSAQPTAVADADAVRLALNVYGQIIMAGYSFATDSVRMFVTNPDSSQHSEVTLCSLTGIAQSTTSYCGYWDMDGYSTFSVHCIASTTPTDTTTYTVECSVEDNGTAPASCAYVDVTTSLNEMGGNDHNASYVDEATILIPEFTVPFKYCRVKYVTNAGGGDDGALECFVKRMY